MNDTQLLELLATTDAYADEAALPDAAWSRDAALVEIERRMKMTDTKTLGQVTPAPHRPRRRTWLAAAAAFAIVVVAGIVIALVARDPGAETTQPSTTTTTEATTTTTTEATTTTTTPASGPTAFPRSFGSVDVGTYFLDSFEPPITFTVDPSFFFVQQNSPDLLALSAPNSRDPGDRDMVLFRLAALSDPAEPQQGGEGWPARDFAGWLDNPPAGVVVVDRGETTLDGFEAIHAELQLSDIECPEGGICVLLGWGSHTVNLQPGSIYRFWVIDDGADDPLAAVMAITNERDRSWIDAFENLLLTFEFGE